MSKILFLLKKRDNQFTCDDWYNTPPGQGGKFSSGLANSAQFMVDMLNAKGVHEAVLEEVIDGSFLQRRIIANNPDLIVLEAIWLPPSIVAANVQIYPNKRFVVRVHSEIPFLAGEGIAMDWIQQYAAIPNVYIAPNSPRAMLSLQAILPPEKVVLMPNYYPIEVESIVTRSSVSDPSVIDVGCFGAVRAMKNQLQQAIAAIQLGKLVGKRIRFHLNASRQEGQGAANVLKNIRNLFNANSPHELVEHPWMDRETFLEVVSSMDVCMQVSLSETFNIVAADAVRENIPIVVSHEISWIDPQYRCDPNSIDDIFTTLKRTYARRSFGHHAVNRKRLYKYSENSADQWHKVIKELWQ